MTIYIPGQDSLPESSKAATILLENQEGFGKLLREKLLEFKGEVNLPVYDTSLSRLQIRPGQFLEFNFEGH